MAQLQTLRYPEVEDVSGKITSTIGLKFTTPRYFLNNKAHVVCRSNVEGHVNTTSKTIFLDPASNAAYNHQFGSAGDKCTLLFMISFHNNTISNQESIEVLILFYIIKEKKFFDKFRKFLRFSSKLRIVVFHKI